MRPPRHSRRRPADTGQKHLPTRMPGGDFNFAPTPSGRHLINCIEQDCPGVFEIACSCGQSTWTPWGEESAREIASLHLWAVGAPERVRIR